MQCFTELGVWQEARQLVLAVYRASSGFPRSELYGLTAQLRRAIVSVAANVAEGSKRRTNSDYARFLNLAESSLAEAQCLLMLARDLGFLSAEDAGSLLDGAGHVARRLHALRTKVEPPA